jgi:hypothetical protein
MIARKGELWLIKLGRWVEGKLIELSGREEKVI